MIGNHFTSPAKGKSWNPQSSKKKINQVIAKCWSDGAFKQKLMADPHGALKSAGVDVPPGMTVKAVENSDKVFHLVVPPAPTDLSDNDLEKVAAGGGTFYDLQNYHPHF